MSDFGSRIGADLGRRRPWSVTGPGGGDHGEGSVGTEAAGQVLIRAGVPGKPNLKVDHGKPYPNTTTDVAKLLAERGLTVTYDDERDQRSYVSFYAAESGFRYLSLRVRYWAGSGNFFSDLIKELIGKEKPEDTILHLEFRVIPRKGSQKMFKTSGMADDVLRAMDKFERGVPGASGEGPQTGRPRHGRPSPAVARRR
jgi:hypothetical protein